MPCRTRGHVPLLFRLVLSGIHYLVGLSLRQECAVLSILGKIVRVAWYFTMFEYEIGRKLGAVEYLVTFRPFFVGPKHLFLGRYVVEFAHKVVRIVHTEYTRFTCKYFRHWETVASVGRCLVVQLIERSPSPRFKSVSYPCTCFTVRAIFLPRLTTV